MNELEDGKQMQKVYLGNRVLSPYLAGKRGGCACQSHFTTESLWSKLKSHPGSKATDHMHDVDGITYWKFASKETLINSSFPPMRERRS